MTCKDFLIFHVLVDGSSTLDGLLPHFAAKYTTAASYPHHMLGHHMFVHRPKHAARALSITEEQVSTTTSDVHASCI